MLNFWSFSDDSEIVRQPLENINEHLSTFQKKLLYVSKKSLDKFKGYTRVTTDSEVRYLKLRITPERDNF